MGSGLRTTDTKPRTSTFPATKRRREGRSRDDEPCSYSASFVFLASSLPSLGSRLGSRASIRLLVASDEDGLVLLAVRGPSGCNPESEYSGDSKDPDGIAASSCRSRTRAGDATSALGEVAAMPLAGTFNMTTS